MSAIIKSGGLSNQKVLRFFISGVAHSISLKAGL